MLFLALVEGDVAKSRELAEVARKQAIAPGLRTIVQYATPVGKGVHIFEATSEEAVFRYFAPLLPYVKNVEIYPALPLDKILTMTPR